MEEDKIREMIEQADPENKLDPAAIEDIIVTIRTQQEESKHNKNLNLIETERNLRMQMEGEDDWRKRAAIAARIISLGLE